MSRIGEPVTTMRERTAVLLRPLTALSLALVVGGCTQDQRPRAGVAMTDCGLQQSYGGRDYAWINMEVYKVRSESRSAFSSLARPPDSEARAKAVELNRKLDALDQRAEERKAAAGECFGGKAAERYARTKQLIAEQRKDTAEGAENTLAKNDVLEAERLAFATGAAAACLSSLILVSPNLQTDIFLIEAPLLWRVEPSG